MRTWIVWTLAAVCCLVARPSSAQLVLAKDSAIVYGHHHVYATDIDAHKRFWGALGGGSATFGPLQIVRFPNVLVVLTAGKSPAASKGSIVDHVGFYVQDLRATLERVKAAGFPIVTEAEWPASVKVEFKDGIGYILPARSTLAAFVLGPDGAKVELVERKDPPVPITMGHVHFFHPQPAELRAWYAKVFGDNIPGFRMNVDTTTTRMAGTRGRVFDHIGFEVRDLEAFTKKLDGMGIKLDRPYTKLPAINNLGVAFLTDPWGTYIELTEGLAAVQ